MTPQTQAPAAARDGFGATWPPPRDFAHAGAAAFAAARSGGTTDDFDADFGVDEWHGTNAFFRDDDGRIFRTYFVNDRGDEAMGSTWTYLDITALGRRRRER
jgi:predicted dithiol-disulfide oxidoreductase (DUF899 family)